MGKTKPHYIDGTKDAWFSKWTKNNLRAGSSGLKITDIDSLRIWYDSKILKYMIIELKKNCEKLTKETMENWQRQVYKAIDNDLWQFSQKYKGFFIISISGLDINDETTIHISNRSYLYSASPIIHKITLEQLICFLNFDSNFDHIVDKCFNGYYVKKYEGQGDLFRDIVICKWENQYLSKEF